VFSLVVESFFVCSELGFLCSKLGFRFAIDFAIDFEILAGFSEPCSGFNF